MKINVIEYNNAQISNSYVSWTGEAFKTYRGASEYLMSRGFNIHCICPIKGGKEVYFYLVDNDNIPFETRAKIIEVEFTDK